MWRDHINIKYSQNRTRNNHFQTSGINDLLNFEMYRIWSLEQY